MNQTIFVRRLIIPMTTEPVPDATGAMAFSGAFEASTELLQHVLDAQVRVLNEYSFEVLIIHGDHQDCVAMALARALHATQGDGNEQLDE